MLFSQRKGFVPAKKAFQVDFVDEELLNGLWNVLTFYYWAQIPPLWINSDSKMQNLILSIWTDYFKATVDSLNSNWENVLKEIKFYFYHCYWYEVYDLIEFVAKQDTPYKDIFIEHCNKILKRENAAYRFVGDTITQITSEEEIVEIEEGLAHDKLFSVHINKSLELLSDRKSPDYRNSIKESISAVEAVCKMILKDNKTTLGGALSKIEEKFYLHGALKEAFNRLYGYTSDADGIRHALLEESNLDHEDAKYMLVSCSAFVNYLIIKSSKAGIKL